MPFFDWEVSRPCSSVAPKLVICTFFCYNGTILAGHEYRVAKIPIIHISIFGYGLEVVQSVVLSGPLCHGRIIFDMSYCFFF